MAISAISLLLGKFGATAHHHNAVTGRVLALPRSYGGKGTNIDIPQL